MMSIIRNAIVWLAVLALLTGCSGKKRSSEDDKTADGKTGDGDKNVDLRTAKPDFTLTSRDFDQEAKKDEEAAVAKYKNKLVEMTGVVGGGGPGQLLLEGVRLQSGLFASVLCTTTDRDAWKNATPGKTVKLRGKGKMGLIALEGCVIIEVTGPPPVEITADQLAKDLLSDMEGTKKKYDGKYLLISGEVASTDDEKRTVNFQTTMPNPVVTVFFGFAQTEELKQLKKGQQFTALCEFVKLTSDSKEIALNNGNIWKK